MENGVTTVRLSAIGPEIPVCSANVTCAAFQVEDVELAEKYLAEAEALLEPFEEGRRRLAEKCLDPYTSVKERDAAQALAQKQCKGDAKGRLGYDCLLLKACTLVARYQGTRRASGSEALPGSA